MAEVRDLRPAEAEAARQLLAANGWTGSVSTLEQFRLLLSRSQRALVAVEDGEVVGFLRALTDGLENGYLSMLVVSDKHRRKGIGRALVSAVVDADRKMTWVLRAARPGAPEFWERVGFVRSQVAMERPRSR